MKHQSDMLVAGTSGHFVKKQGFKSHLSHGICHSTVVNTATVGSVIESVF
jgi:hypothetical protein